MKLERGSPEWRAAWKCCGCGMVHGEDLAAACDCPTACLGRGGRGYSEIVLKVYPPTPELVERVAAMLVAITGTDPDELIHHPAQKSWETPTWPPLGAVGRSGPCRYRCHARASPLMARDVPEWIGKDENSPVPPRVRARVFLSHQGVCHISKRKIRPGDSWQCDHVIAIINGGQNRESNLAPALTEAHAEKTQDDVAEKSKVARVRAKFLGVYPKSRFKIRSRGFPKRSDT